jgi:hypothetical protein
MKNSLLIAFCALALGLMSPAQAELAEDAPDNVIGFIESNILATFYHELGHAIIEIEALPIFGQEEDAADVFSVVLIDDFFDEETAVQITYDAAFGFLGFAQELDAAGEEPAFWDVHGPDLQRYYTMVCLFYGADPDEREDIADELGLPSERAETCAEEFTLASDSWGPVLDDLARDHVSHSMRIGGTSESSLAGQLATEIMRDEIDAFNEMFELSEDLTVTVDDCGEVNAFFDPSGLEITICTEYVDFLASMAADL